MAAEVGSDLVGGRYRLSEPLGAGGMGRVWQAHDTVLQRDVAVKAVDLPDHLAEADRSALRSRVLREARAAARIDHPASVRVFDVVEDGNRLYVVMELVRAPTLSEVVERHGPLSPARAAAVGLGLLGALEAAHSAGIVHRDVKPANVMMLDDGGVKLADFGIASVKDDTRITAAGFVLGTPSYMSPEQAAGRPTEAPADLWGLGALLYFAVEGVPPFDRGEALPTLHAVLHDDPRPMERADGLGPAVGALLAKDAAARPTVAATRASLERLTRVGPRTEPAPAATAVFSVPPSTPPPPPPEVSPPSRPPRSAPVVRPGHDGSAGWLVALGVVALVALVAVLALAGAGDDPSTESASTGGPSSTEAPVAEDEVAPTTVASTAPPPSTSTTTTGPRPDGVPGNWVRYDDPSVGYTIWHPPSWEPQRSGGSSTDVVDPATGDYLRVDYVDDPGDDPEEAWEQASESFADRYDDYEELRIEEREYQGFSAAIWEYTYKGQHATNLGFVTDDYGFALNFQTAEERWDDRQDVRRAFEASFEAP